ncbi:hypothetical protein [Marinilabilia salmonicolor]|jgi:hypothetical protein|uniref:Uncharacterized protein n=1 Tax=Marinilabilia salmonicolor TaxID=989 RepID=A0A2T0XN08_9BACT|nr:hypothetical protein [Marinilabilia salmonicolor]PRZ00262.1 hypothetical protein BY457_10688 [Marinilabilia salmonicolor]RCW38378.1 hypothetical protein DFO77_104136 [Marinilabilia salmonicolor]
MIDNPALDIAIGLAFTYGIYSLIATVATEIISTFLKLRGKNLRTAIIRMLDNGTDKNQTTKQLLSTTSDKLETDLSRKFLNQPEIRFLGRISNNGKERCPSYIKPATFARALLNTIDYSWSENTDLTTLKEKLNPDTPTHKLIINMLDEANGDIAKFKELSAQWFNDTMDRASGWYKRKTQLITLIAAAIIVFPLNLNTIEISRKLSSDKEARIEMVEAAGNYIQTYSLVNETNQDNLAKLDSLNNQMQILLAEAGKTESILDMNIQPKTPDQWFVYIFGCLLTVIALSLGAPFWFDLLSRFIKLRNTGVPEKTEIKDSRQIRKVSVKI